MKLSKALLIVFSVLLLDQISKIYIKLNYQLASNSNDAILDWGKFKLVFYENAGAAWGTEIPGDYGKIILVVFRIFAVMGIGYWLWSSIKKHSHKILIICISLILAGAIGNIIDSVFYGVLFSDSYHGVAEFLPEEGGYAPIFYGKVVDMLYFPLFDGTFPSWVPGIGGNKFTFFNAVFNIADSAITIGVILLLLFSKKAFPKN
ncbi:lipoprotein signal peptidase [Nonlabens tegetincola]|uniref:Lipoprotein signal peptidase n=1 Tax=Nonlabens tegetincola TaxID=323273 RepID=A0A090QJG4_9FLAO|nr:lipoprotein signal peptidase [Nonlabens tegetincola]ARN72392.1 lipoprotein signal peptidase [Nonlabens tegetincola]MEE2802779.1 lipoprotein signal peptidase [Bacteroidota bacterium]GAK95681.1 lipoprotein signal peptidase [Nonlabens tegetincola]